MKLLVLDDKSLGKNVLKNYNEEDIIPYNYDKFKDGEMIVELLKPVRGDDVIVLATISDPVNENLVKVLICVDALKRASAKSINLICPYLGYSRQDRRAKPWQPITARLVADLLECAGVNRVITCDLHAKQIEGFYSIPIDNIPLMVILGHQWRKTLTEEFHPENYVVVSPDHGGVTRAREFMNQAQIPNLVVINKYREKANVVSSMQVIGDVKDKNAIIIDDLVDTGGTLIKAAGELKNLGAKHIYIYTTHGVLSGDAIKNISNCDDIDKLVITNTIDKSNELINDKIQYVDISKLIVGIIDTFKNNGYLSEFITKLVLD